VVKVGALVEVRDNTGSAWAPGVVADVRASDGALKISKQGMVADYEWGQCRPL
jgi:hypothetical protein